MNFPVLCSMRHQPNLAGANTGSHLKEDQKLNVQLAPRKWVDTHYREAPSGVIHGGIRGLLKAKDRTRKCEI